MALLTIVPFDDGGSVDIVDASDEGGEAGEEGLVAWKVEMIGEGGGLDDSLQGSEVDVVEGALGMDTAYLSEDRVTTDLDLSSVPKQTRPVLWYTPSPCRRVPQTGLLPALHSPSVVELLASFLPFDPTDGSPAT